MSGVLYLQNMECFYISFYVLRTEDDLSLPSGYKGPIFPCSPSVLINLSMGDTGPVKSDS